MNLKQRYHAIGVYPVAATRAIRTNTTYPGGTAVVGIEIYGIVIRDDR